MMMVLAIATVILVLVGWVATKLWVASREIDQLFKVNADLTAQNQQQRQQIQTQQQEITNAQIQRKHRQQTQHSANDVVDSQLHQHGWFRAKNGGGNGMRSVQSDLSESCRQHGDETSDTCSQSDTSGDL